MRRQIQIQRLEVAERALRRHKPQLHQSAGRIVDKDEQGASGTTILKPAVIRAVKLDQLAQTFSAKTQLVKCPASLAA